MTPVAYTILQVILGAGFYIFCGAVLLGMILLVGYITKTTIPYFISYTIFGISLLLVVIGLVQARFVTITPIAVTIENLPASWEGKTAVLIADTHLGLINNNRFSERVVQKILSTKADFVLHAGDFYDGPAITLPPITAAWKKLADAIPVFYAPGNHEEYGQYANFVQSIRDAGITVLMDDKADYDGVQIIGVTYRGGADNIEVAEVLEKLVLDKNKPSILINHPPTALPTAEKMGIDLQVSGHTHNGQLWPGKYLTKQIYGVYTYGLHKFGDTLQVLTTRGVGTNGPPLRTFNQSEIMLITFERN